MLETKSSLSLGLRCHPFTDLLPKMWSTRRVPRYLAGAAKVGPSAASNESCRGSKGAWVPAKVAFASMMAALTCERSRPSDTSKDKLRASGASRTYFNTAEDPHRPCS